jgi:hypothetical protein
MTYEGVWYEFIILALQYRETYELCPTRKQDSMTRAPARVISATKSELDNVRTAGPQYGLMRFEAFLYLALRKGMGVRHVRPSGSKGYEAARVLQW